MSWFTDISNWFTSLFKQPTKKEQAQYRVSQPYIPPTTSSAQQTYVAPTVKDWYRAEPSPVQQKTGQIGGIETTSRQTQPLAAQALSGIQNWQRNVKEPSYLNTPITYKNIQSFELPATNWNRQIQKTEGATATPQQEGTWTRADVTKQPYSGVTLPTAQPTQWQTQNVSTLQAPAIQVSDSDKSIFGESQVGKSLLDTIGSWINGIGQSKTAYAGESKPVSTSPLFPQSELEKAVSEGSAVATGPGWTKPVGYEPTPVEPGKAETTDFSKLIKEWEKTGVDETYFEKSNDVDTATAISGMMSAGMKPPKLSDERLSKIQDTAILSYLWDVGYRAPQIITATSQELTDLRNTIFNRTNIDIGDNVAITDADVTKIDYKSLINAVDYLTSVSDDDWKRMEEEGIVLRPRFEFVGFDSLGNKQYTFSGWYQDTKYETEEEQLQKQREKQVTQQQWENEQYWSAESVAQRQSQREESYQWQQNKNNEGWSSYYAVLDAARLRPDANEYFSQAGKFDELRRQWETTGGGLSWEQWLAQYDFESEYAKILPEKPYLYNPKMQRINF